MACERRSSGKRRLLRWPRLPETRPAGPRSSKAAHSRRTWRSDRPMNSPAFACVSRPSMTRRTTSRRSSSFLLFATSSVPIHPAPWRHRAAETGHLYLGGTGHFHLAATSKERISAVPSPPPSSLIPSSATRTRRGGATPRRAGDKPHPALQSAGSLSAICNAGLSIIYGLTTVRAALNRPRMRTLIAGIGALGGTIATRAVSAGLARDAHGGVGEGPSIVRASSVGHRRRGRGLRHSGRCARRIPGRKLRPDRAGHEGARCAGERAVPVVDAFARRNAALYPERRRLADPLRPPRQQRRARRVVQSRCDHGRTRHL